MNHLQAIERAPDDLPTKYALAQLLEQRDEFEEALRLCQEIEAVGEQYGGPWYVSSIYLQRGIHGWSDDEEDEPEVPGWVQFRPPTFQDLLSSTRGMVVLYSFVIRQRMPS